jgi:nucleotide-binding universal stress UspA family protein
MKTILLATDGSPSAQLATDEAIELAKATGWPLRVVTVWNRPIPTGYGYAVYPLPADLAALEREHAHSIAVAAVAKAAEAGVTGTFELREGLPAEEVCAAAAETASTLIVIGAHGWGAVKRLLVGSVSTHVLHAAHCPVLIVRAEHTPAEEARSAGAVAGAAA